MARSINKLSARAVETVKAPGRYSDGGNLYLSISANGGRRWVFMYRFAGKQREMGLGSASKAGTSLAKARELAAEARMALPPVSTLWKCVTLACSPSVLSPASASAPLPMLRRTVRAGAATSTLRSGRRP
ncbi:MAG TPA: Arm DNA-binding domain-containing protein [Aestuariivirgaceae bacterium]|nr:Arm DNA-binding domain-containing protein [Aestuariivirgaceae bacterium]